MPIFLAQLAQEDSAASGGNLLFTIVLYAVVIGGLFYFLLIRPQRTRARKHQELVTSLEVDDEVQTIGGIIGTIEFMDDETVVLRTEGGGRLRVVRRALAGRVGEPPA